MNRLHARLLGVALVLSTGATAGGQSPVATNRRTIRLGVASQGIRLDGELRDAVWQTVDSVATLTQVEPRQGDAPSARTVIRVLTTGDAIVFGVLAENPPGVASVAFARQRDAVLDSEDYVKIVLDTYLDGRSGYVFAVNPNGARYDALVANQGEGEDSNWDAIWEAATSRCLTGGRPRSVSRSRVCCSGVGWPGGASTCSAAFSGSRKPTGGPAPSATTR